MIFPSGYYQKTTAILIFLMAVVFSACKNDMETIKALGDPEKEPLMTMVEPEILQYASSQLQGRLRAPRILRFETNKDPYMEFPEGLSLEFYDDQLQTRGRIRANYARYDERNRLWEARYNVEAENSAGDRLNTEQLFWDETLQKIYSEKFTKITNPDGVFIGEGGFTANQDNGDFTGWVLYSSKGTIRLEESFTDSGAADYPSSDIMAVDSVAQPTPMVQGIDSLELHREDEFDAIRQRFSRRPFPEDTLQKTNAAEEISR